MVENNQVTYKLRNFNNLPEVKVPSLHEIWNWQGDTSVLPFKFESVLNSASTDPELFCANDLK